MPETRRVTRSNKKTRATDLVSLSTVKPGRPKHKAQAEDDRTVVEPVKKSRKKNNGKKNDAKSVKVCFCSLVRTRIVYL